MAYIRRVALRPSCSAVPKPKERVCPSTSSNERDISSDQPIDLGSLNGKPFELRIVPGVGIEWSGCPFVKAPTSSVVSEEYHAAARAARMYSVAEHKFAQETVAVIGALYRYTQGRLQIDDVNDTIQFFRLAPNTVKDMLTRLGVDPDRPFRINGQHFVFVNGLISPYDGGIAPNEASNSGDSGRDSLGGSSPRATGLCGD
jgi:hypothetical protein